MTTRAAPRRSAAIPASGPKTPHIRFWPAMASEKVSRVQPCCSDIGWSQKPKPCRTPIASDTMMPLAISTVESFGAVEVLNISDSEGDAVRECNACSKRLRGHKPCMYQCAQTCRMGLHLLTRARAGRGCRRCAWCWASGTGHAGATHARA